MAYPQIYNELFDFIYHRDAELSATEWAQYSAWAANFRLWSRDNFCLISSLFYACIETGKLQILALLLKANPKFIHCEVLNISATERCAPLRRLPTYVIRDNPDGFSYNRKAVLRLILYCCGLEPFQEMISYPSAESMYKKIVPKLKFSNEETIEAFMDQAWQDLQEYRHLLNTAHTALSNMQVDEAAAKYDRAAKQLLSYAEGDQGLHQFYRQEMQTFSRPPIY